MARTSAGNDKERGVSERQLVAARFRWWAAAACFAVLLAAAVLLRRARN
ncbi:hypothetical protein LOC59_06215 [Arthrobacter sp. zg-Y916]|nr:hypothetical protein [Arthrobacter sp. zg-Y916]MCC9193246.1 hypothetical protein [Arthrobacter sp. zg-Y916]